jgi:hypothetical protein
MFNAEYGGAEVMMTSSFPMLNDFDDSIALKFL